MFLPVFSPSGGFLYTYTLSYASAAVGWEDPSYYWHGAGTGTICPARVAPAVTSDFRGASDQLLVH